jgi:hypothetical protein
MSHVLDVLDTMTEFAPAGTGGEGYLSRVVKQNTANPRMRKLRTAVKNAAIMGMVMSNFPKVSGTAAATSVRKVFPD